MFSKEYSYVIFLVEKKEKINKYVALFLQFTHENPI